jgi:large subunit ribosomal protein L14
MKALCARVARALPHTAVLEGIDNSGARKLRIIAVRNYKGKRGRVEAAGVGDYIWAAVTEGKPDIRKQVVNAVIVRQRKEYRRANGMRIKFEDNAAVLIKDDLGNPKGTVIKGPIAKEAADRWPLVAKIAKLIV